MHGDIRNAYKILVRNPEGMGPLGRPSHRWECNIEMNFKEMGCEVVGWIHMVQDRVQW
jgi:hypothetical protein